MTRISVVYGIVLTLVSIVLGVSVYAELMKINQIATINGCMHVYHLDQDTCIQLNRRKFKTSY